MGKLPALQFYPADWRKDIGVQSLSLEDRAIWFEMICIMHESEQRGKLVINGKPMTDEMVARLIGISEKKYKKSKEKMENFGVFSVSDGVVFNRRMVRDEYIRNVRIAAGSKGGNPNLTKNLDNQKINQTHEQTDKQNTTPSSSSSSSTSIKKDKRVSTLLDFSNYEPELVDALKIWVDYRKGRGGKLTVKNQKSLDFQRDRLKRLSNNNKKLADAIVKCATETNWDGLYPIPENLKSVYLPEEKRMVV